MKRINTISILLAAAIYVFLIIEWLKPVSSQTMVLGAVTELICVSYAVKNYRNIISYITCIFGVIPSVIMLCVFFIWMIMGLGA